MKFLIVSLLLMSLFTIPSSAQSIGGGLVPDLTTAPRHAGKPDPRWRDFDWRYTDRLAHEVPYRVYFYEEEEWSLRFILPQLEEQIGELITLFDYVPKVPIKYMLFTSLGEFRQANVFNIGEGVQGVTSTEEATMAVPYIGELEHFQHVSKHEMVHQFQVQKIRGLAGAYAQRAMAIAPLWFIEGQAEYYTLGGLDPESRFYIRDLLLHASKKDKYTMPDFFEAGPMSFITVYKVGQAKIDFLELIYGEGTAQEILNGVIKMATVPFPGEAPPEYMFRQVVTSAVGESPEQIESRWREYLQSKYAATAKLLPHALKEYKAIGSAGENLDTYAFSDDGGLLAVREINPKTGITSVQLIDRTNDDERYLVARTLKRNITSLFFMESPTIGLSEDYVAFGVRRPGGPAIEYRRIARDEDGLELGSPEVIELGGLDLLGVTSVAIHPESGALAFVGLSAKGWQNIYLTQLSPENGKHVIEKLTDSYYAWKDLSWSRGELPVLLAASNRTETAAYNIFSIDAVGGRVTQLTDSLADQLAPFGTPEKFYFQSWATGTSQIHLSDSLGVQVLTGAKTMLKEPTLVKGELYAMGFLAGKFNLFRIPEAVFLPEVERRPQSISELGGAKSPWEATLLPPGTVTTKDYEPFQTSGFRMDQLGGYLSSGGVAGIIASSSDLMRNYQITAQYQSPGNSGLSNGQISFTSRQGRSTWTLGGYQLAEPRIANRFSEVENRAFYKHEELGVMGAWTYPLGSFSYFRAGGRLAGVSRENLEYENGEQPVTQITESSEGVIAPVLALGFDEVVYSQFAGPTRGESALLEYTTSYYPERGALNQRLRLDLADYTPLWGDMTLATQGVFGAATGDQFRTPFYISSPDILRAYPWGDRHLLGNYVAAAKTELRFPIGDFFKFPPLRGLVSYDYGTVVEEWDNADLNVASSAAAGLSLNLPPFSMSFIWATPLQLPTTATERDTVMHFSLRYLYL